MEEQQSKRSDHDILIRVETIVEGLVDDVRDVKNGTAKDINDLKANKLDKTDGDELFKRIRVVENKQWMYAGGVIVVSFIISTVAALIAIKYHG